MAFAYQMTAPGVENVARVEAEEVEPAAGELKVRITASSLNFHDLVTVTGLIPGLSYPRVPMSDGCGEVVAVGDGVSAFSAGDRVLPLFYPLWRSGRPTPDKKKLILGESIDGCLQEYLCISADSVVSAPAHMTDQQAATLVCAGLTAWYPLMEENRLQAHHTVLLQGTGGVSLAALQIAKAVGAKVAITSSSDEKLKRCEAMGADYLVNYLKSESWEEEVLTQTGGVDIALDTGGQNTLGRTVRCTRDDGFIAVIGVLGGFDAAPVSVIEVMQKNLAIKGITVGCRDSFDRLCRFTERHSIQPEISHVVPASQLDKAIETMGSGGHFGKIAVSVE